MFLLRIVRPRFSLRNSKLWLRLTGQVLLFGGLMLLFLLFFTCSYLLLYENFNADFSMILPTAPSATEEIFAFANYSWSCHLWAVATSRPPGRWHMLHSPLFANAWFCIRPLKTLANLNNLCHLRNFVARDKSCSKRHANVSGRQQKHFLSP